MEAKVKEITQKAISLAKNGQLDTAIVGLESLLKQVPHGDLRQKVLAVLVQLKAKRTEKAESGTLSADQLKAQYGVNLVENQGIDEVKHVLDTWDGTSYVPWDAPGVKFIRVRLLSDPGYPMWDISYAYAEHKGKVKRVRFPFQQIPKGTRFRKFLYAQASQCQFKLNATGFFDALSTLC